MIGTVIAGYQVVTINNIDRNSECRESNRVAISDAGVGAASTGLFPSAALSNPLLYTSPTLPRSVSAQKCCIISKKTAQGTVQECLRIGLLRWPKNCF